MKWDGKSLLKASAAVVGIGTFFIVGVIFYVRFAYRSSIFEAQKVPSKPVIMVLGASLKSDGQPSDALLDRLQVGMDLYREGKGSLILVTGDDGKMRSDEIKAMRKYVLDNGIPESALKSDGQGYRTYESCTRAKTEFGIDKAIVVTQEFHLPRALYLCNKLGVESIGVPADLRSYKEIARFTVRDWLASFKAWIDINLWTPKPPV